MRPGALLAAAVRLRMHGEIKQKDRWYPFTADQVIRWQRGVHGFATWPEIALLEKAGLSPAEVLAAATTNAAPTLGLTAEIGALEVGHRADLDILDADPSLGLARALPTLRWVVHDGIAHTPAESMEL